MSEVPRTPVQGPIVEEQVEFTLVELSRACGVDEQQVSALIVEGVIEPMGGQSTEWRFSGSSLRRARVAVRLSQDLGINTPGVALALDLIDEIEALRRRLQRGG